MHKYCGSNVDCSLGSYSVVFKYCCYRNIRVRSQSCGKSCISVRFLYRAAARDGAAGISRVTAENDNFTCYYLPPQHGCNATMVMCTCAERFPRKVPRNRFANLSVPANCANAAVCRVPAAAAAAAAEAAVMNGSPQ